MRAIKACTHIHTHAHAHTRLQARELNKRMRAAATELRDRLKMRPDSISEVRGKLTVRSESRVASSESRVASSE